MKDVWINEIRKAPLFWACVISLAMLAVFGVLQLIGASVLALPAQWIWISLLPILLALVTGGYITKAKFLGAEFDIQKPGTKYIGPPPAAGTPKLAVRASTRDKGFVVGGAAIQPDVKSLSIERDKEYERVGGKRVDGKEVDGLFLAHIYKHSTIPGMQFDVTIFIMRHRTGDPHSPYKQGLVDIKDATFDLGSSWRPNMVSVINDGGFIGITTSAWGTFLATCEVTFTDGKPPVILHRYIDFEMAPV